MANLYSVIESLCERDGIKPGRLCSKIGISRGVLSDLKSGRSKSLSLANMQRIANYFHVSTDIFAVDRVLGQETKEAPTPEDERKERLDKLAAEIREQNRILKSVSDSVYNFYLSLRTLAGGSMPIPREIAFLPEQSASIDAEITDLITKFLETATPEEASDFWSRYDKIGQELRKRLDNLDNPVGTAYPTPEEIEAYSEMAKNLVIQQFSSEKKPDASVSSAKESDVV